MSGISPFGESFPPSKLNPKPVPSFSNSTRINVLSFDVSLEVGVAVDVAVNVYF